MFSYNNNNSFNKITLFIVLFTVFNGAIRKWIFTSGPIGNIIQLLQVILPFILFYSNSNWLMPWKDNLIKLFIFLLILLAFNPLNKTLIHGLLGILIYSPFILIIYFYLLNKPYIDIRPLCNYFTIFCFFEIIIAFVQYQLPPDNILNRYADIEKLGEGQTIAMVGNAVRVTGSFSYISGFTSFLIFTSILTWVLVKIQYNSNIVILLFTGCITATLMTGSRSTMLIVLIIYASMFLSEFSFDTFMKFTRKLFIPFILIFFIAQINDLNGIGENVKQSFENFESRRIENFENGEQNVRLTQELFDVLNFTGKHPLFGVGLGATYQGATSLFGTSDYVKEYGGYEGEMPRIILEGGFILFFFRLFLIGIICSKLNFNFVSKFIFFVLLSYSSPLVFNVYNSLFFMLGLIFLDNVSQFENKKYIIN
jgi:hypothetical protein